MWDLDQTLWEGVLSESSDVHLKSGIKDIIQALDQRGILHSVASKNDHEKAYEKLKELGIEEYFLYSEIGWNAKSSAVANIQKSLNINMDTIIFIDDDPFERDEVNSVYPEVECMDANEYRKLLEHPRLNPKFITSDSINRRKMYLEDIQRKEDEENYVGPKSKFLSSLNMHVFISQAKMNDLKRVEELTIRTNQLNSTGITYGYDQLTERIRSQQDQVLVCELTDKYGSYGKIGIALIEMLPNRWIIKLLLVSCRVMSRGIGSIFLNYILHEAKEQGVKVFAEFKHTNVNKMMYITYKMSNFMESGNDRDGDIIVLENDMSKTTNIPSHVKIN